MGESPEADKKIRAVNPSAEKALGSAESELVGRAWEDIAGLAASAPLRRALEKQEPSYGVILQFSSTSYVANILPVIHEEQTEGWLITMQEFAAIEDLDERVRQEKRRRGYVARAHFADFPARSPAMKALIAEAAPKLAAAGFDVEIVEKHHNQKVDAPSGTALALADAANAALGGEYEYVYDRTVRRMKRPVKEIGISAVRGGSIVGDHDVIFAGQDEVITFSHRAYSRAVFGKGAVEAAKFLAGKESGFYTMSDVLK